MKRIDATTRRYSTYPSRKQYERIRDVCIDSLTRYVGFHKDRLRIELKLPAYLKFPVSFPKPAYAKNLEGGFSYNAQHVLNWLHEKGYSDVSSDDIAKAKVAFGQVMRRFEESFNVDIDIGQDMEYNIDIDKLEE